MADYLNTVVFRCGLTFCRANAGSEFVLANTLAKWKKLESNKFNFSQGLAKKVYQEDVL